MNLSSSNIKTLLSELCETLKGKLSCSSDALEYVVVGEYALALEFLADWCIDAEPQVTLSAEEIMKFKEIGDLMVNQTGRNSKVIQDRNKVYLKSHGGNFGVDS